MDVTNFKIKGKDIQSGIIEWEQLVSSLTKDHAIKLEATLLRAFLMNILPKWMADKILGHLDRLPRPPLGTEQLRARVQFLAAHLVGLPVLDLTQLATKPV